MLDTEGRQAYIRNMTTRTTATGTTDRGRTMATKNHKGQTAADVRTERIAEARDLALSILEAVEQAVALKAPAAGWNWGHAGDWGHLVERLQDAHGTALMFTGIGAPDAVQDPDLAATFLRVRDLLTGAVPGRPRTYPAFNAAGRRVRVTIPASER